MHVLVTGATGFLGRHLVRALAARGDDVTILSRGGQASLSRVPGAGAAHAWSPGAGAPPAAALAGVDAVVHLAGESVVGRWTAAKRARIRDSRVHGTRELVEAMLGAATPPRVLVSASAIGYYGERGDAELPESAAAGSDFLATTCTAWEAEAQRAETGGVRVVRPRWGIVLARDGGALASMLRPARLGLSGPIGSGRQWWSWIHVDDVVGIVLHAVDGDAAGALNGAAPGAVRQRAFAKALGGVLNRPSFAPLPAFAARAILGGFASELLSSKHVVPTATLASGYAFRQPTLEDALRAALGR